MIRGFTLLLVVMGASTASAQWNVSGSNIYYNTGNVGIGISTPTNRLQIGPNIQGWNGNDLVISNNNGGLAIHNDVTHSYIYGSQAIAIRPGFGQMAIYASSAGMVGIQSTNPQGIIQIGDYRPVIVKSNGGNGIYGSEIGFNAVLNTSVVPNKFRKLGGTSQNGGASIAVDYSGNMLFQMYDAQTENETIVNYQPQIAFFSNGNVGIGTTDPKGYKLAIAGKAIAEEIVVKLQANWPDYVFEETYQLPPLTEVALYIKQHKHLPEIPSEKEISENGVQVGEMNVVLLKKVEELTLYLIEQNKKIELQQMRLEAQMKLIEAQQKQINTILTK